MDDSLKTIGIRQIRSILSGSEDSGLSDDVFVCDLSSAAVNSEQEKAVLDLLQYPIRIDGYTVVFCVSGHVTVDINLHSFDVSPNTLLINVPGNILRVSMSQVTDTLLSEARFVLIVLSRELARQLRVKVGDRVYAYFFEQAVRARRFTITGIYCTNMNDFDESLVFTDLETVHTLCRWDSGQYSGVEIAIDDFNELDAVSARVESKVNHTQDAYGASYSSPTIVDLYPTIFSWLSLLDMDVIVILILMVLVSGFTMVSGLLIIILERTNFIGVMKALGASNSTLRHLFLYFAAFIVIRGLIIGNIVAFALMFLQKYTGFIHLDPESYYMDTVPLLIHWGYIVLINVSTLIICVLALIMPSYLISNIHPARSIRFE